MSELTKLEQAREAQVEQRLQPTSGTASKLPPVGRHRAEVYAFIDGVTWISQQPGGDARWDEVLAEALKCWPDFEPETDPVKDRQKEINAAAKRFDAS